MNDETIARIAKAVCDELERRRMERGDGREEAFQKAKADMEARKMIINRHGPQGNLTGEPRPFYQPVESKGL